MQSGHLHVECRRQLNATCRERACYVSRTRTDGQTDKRLLWDCRHLAHGINNLRKPGGDNAHNCVRNKQRLR